MRTKVIPYHNINEKDARRSIPLSDEEALIRALDLMDFYASLISQNQDLKLPADEVHWIELKYLSNDQRWNTKFIATDLRSPEQEWGAICFDCGAAVAYYGYQRPVGGLQGNLDLKYDVDFLYQPNFEIINIRTPFHETYGLLNFGG